MSIISCSAKQQFTQTTSKSSKTTEYPSGFKPEGYLLCLYII